MTTATKIYPTMTIKTIETIDEQTAIEYRCENDRFENWRNGRQSYNTNEIPNDLKHVDNDLRGKLEQFEFKNSKPDKYFCYWSKRQINESGSYQIWLTTFMGNELLQVIPGSHNEWRDNFGGIRVSFTAIGINGVWYHGTYFKSSGDYCRIQKLKRNPNTGEQQ